MPLVSLLSSDGHQFLIESTDIRRSGTISRIIEVFTTDENEDDDILVSNQIPLSNVSSTVLEKVLQWCSHHANCEDRRTEIEEISEWNRRYLEMENEHLVDLILSANYLDIQQLLELCCMHIGRIIKGKSADEIRRAFQIENDLTPEEEEQIVKETAWIYLDPSIRPKAHFINESLELFPLLELPNEIISLVLQLLPTEDRLISRINRKLFALESNSQYGMKELSIGRGFDEDIKEEEKVDSIHTHENHGKVVMNLIGPCSSYIDVLLKLASGSTIESLFFLCDWEERQLIPYIKSLRVHELTVAMDQEIGNDEMNDQNFDEWTRDRKSLNIQMGGFTVTGETLYRVYNSMASSLIPLLSLHISIPAWTGRSTLHLLGISYSRGLFTSRRKDATFFVDEMKKRFVIQIGSNMRIGIKQRMLNNAIE
ncbi:hypothetical protein PMAYCL1PPCAC_29875, partial [Pristionchus mayeri]